MNSCLEKLNKAFKKWSKWIDFWWI